MECTIISACPFPLDEIKPGLQPGVFRLPAAKLEVQDIEVLVVSDSQFPVYMDADRGSFLVTEPAQKVADAVVEDFCKSQLGADTKARPALFWVEGAYDKPTAKKLLHDKILEAIKNQGEWFRKLVTLADDDWAKYHQHKFITDIQRFAGKALGLQREWLVKPESIKTQACPGCATEISGRAIKCPHCQTIVNVDAWTALQATQQAAMAKASK